MRREDPTSLLRDIGRRIAELRNAHGWTQEELAERLGINRRYLARLERGGQNLTVHRLAWLAGNLGCRVVDLLAPPADRRVRVGRPKRRAEGV